MRPAPPPGAPVAPPRFPIRLRAGRVPVSGPINRDLGRLVRPPSRGPARGRLPAPRCGGGIKTFSMGGGGIHRSAGPPYRPVLLIPTASLLTGLFDRLGVPIHRSFLIPTFFRIGGGLFWAPRGSRPVPGPDLRSFRGDISVRRPEGTVPGGRPRGPPRPGPGRRSRE